MVQWLRICQPVQGTTCSVPGTRRSHMPWSTEARGATTGERKTAKVSGPQEKSLQLEASAATRE